MARSLLPVMLLVVGCQCEPPPDTCTPELCSSHCCRGDVCEPAEVCLSASDAGPSVTVDAGAPEDSGVDGGPSDAGLADAGTADAGGVDAGAPDAGVDAGGRDAGAPDAGSADAGPVVAGGLCRADGWCWNVPLPQGNNLFAVWASSAQDVWFAGDVTMMHFDGTTFIQVPAPIARYEALWASSPTDVWAVGSGATIARWNGSQWVRMTPPNTSEQFTAIWGFGPDDVWVGGYSVFHWNGTSWATFPTSAVSYVTDIHGTSSTNVYFIDGRDSLAHWDGVTFTMLEYPIFGGLTYGLNALWVQDPTRPRLGANNAFLLYDGGFGDYQRTGSVVRSMWGVGGSLSAVGDQGHIWQLDRGSWDASVTTMAQLRGLGGVAPDDLWAAGSGGEVLHLDASRWTSRLTPSPFRNLATIFAAAPNEVWAATYDGALGKWDGARWTMFADAGFGGAHVVSFTGVSGDIWGVGTSGLVIRTDGGVPSVVAFPATGDAARATRHSATEVWVVAQPLPSRSYALYRWDGVAWAQVALPASEYNANDVVSFNGEIFVVGVTDVFRRVGNGWARTDAGYTDTLHVVPPNHLWSGRPSALSRWTDGGWEVHPINLQYPLSVVSRLCGRSPNDLWVFDGFYNALAHADAGVVTPFDNPTFPITDCSTDSNGKVWLSAGAGDVLWRQ